MPTDLHPGPPDGTAVVEAVNGTTLVTVYDCRWPIVLKKSQKPEKSTFPSVYGSFVAL
jgi:hypothetical protein